MPKPHTPGMCRRTWIDASRTHPARLVLTEDTPQQKAWRFVAQSHPGPPGPRSAFSDPPPPWPLFWPPSLPSPHLPEPFLPTVQRMRVGSGKFRALAETRLRKQGVGKIKQPNLSVVVAPTSIYAATTYAAPSHRLGVLGRHLRMKSTAAARREALNPKPSTLDPRP